MQSVAEWPITHGAELDFRDGKPGRRLRAVRRQPLDHLAGQLKAPRGHYETGLLTLRILVGESAKPSRVQLTEGADGRTIQAQTTRGSA